MKLKTLKDIPADLSLIRKKAELVYRKSDLRKEAIKWINKNETYPASPEEIFLLLTPEAKDWIKYFFNITEKDVCAVT